MPEIKIHPSDTFKAICPQFIGAALFAEVRNLPTSPTLWEEIRACGNELRTRFTTETIKLRSGILATRSAYKAAGKVLSRYRPACEQLARRILQGKDLYSIDTLVDIGNLVSLQSGYSTAALDAGKIEGNVLQLDLGRKDEPYEGIGRGMLNIEHLPVYRDSLGGIATPTSDSVRTMISPSTTRLLLLINGYDGAEDRVEATVRFAQELLCRHAGSDGGHYHFY